MNIYTLKNWLKTKAKIVEKMNISTIKERRPQDWNVESQLHALHQTHALSGEALQAWCRENGLFPHHLTDWKAAFCAGIKTPTNLREMRTLKEENARLKRELTRKEKALAEAAALLILQKKFRALWEGEEK